MKSTLCSVTPGPVMLGSVMLVLGLTAPAFAASPALNGPSPRGAQRGTEVNVVLNGGNLSDAAEVMFYEPGITVTKLAATNNENVAVTFKIAPDAPLGVHRIRVRTKTGLTDLRNFFVSALPHVDEKEPNTDFKTPQAVPMNSTVSGVVDNEDVDYYVVDAKKGDRITAEVEAMRMGITMFDPYVAILNSARFEMSSSDDNALVYQDGVASVIAPEDGKYIVQVRDSSYGGNGSCLYRVHIGNYPRPMGTIPSGGKPGEKLKIKFLGDVAGEFEQEVTLPKMLTERFPVIAQDAKGFSPSANWLRVGNLPNVIEQEPNDNHEKATKFPAAPAALNGVLGAKGDIDHFRFPAKKGEVYDVRVHARSLRSAADPVLYMALVNNGAMLGNDDSAGPDSYFRATIPQDGEYVIWVVDHLQNGGPNYHYRIEVTPVQPKLTLSVGEFVQYVQPVPAVPKGNHFALMINASRIDFGGPLKIEGLDLPKGVTLECPGMHPGLSSVPVMFHAAADAAPAGALVDLVATLDDPAQKTLKVEGHLQQDVVLIRGLNQVPVWTEPVPKLALAVTDEAPFSIEIVQPKVPIVLDGVMNLKVVAKRKPDFKAPIKIDMLWLPPGLNASREISIPEGKDEALIPMNAAGNASQGDWKIAVTGQATVGNGPIMVCTPFATLKIADRYLNFAFESAACEQGKDTEIVVKVQKLKDYPGQAQVTLYGLPNKAVTDVKQITKETAELIFKVKTDKETPAGSHKNLFCQVIVTENGEPILHTLGGGQIRVDVPLPPKKDEPKPATPMPAAPAAPAVAAAPPKRLTRLEQLRLEQQEREKAKAQAASQAGK